MNVTLTAWSPDTETAAEWIERGLREMIVQLELQPGTRLSEQEIADRFSVSRQPVREALISLARAKLIEIKPKQGSFVTRISARRMTEARFVRECVETAIVKRACDNFDPYVRSRLDGIMEAQGRASAAGDLRSFQREDENFHKALALGSGCELAWEVISDIKAHIDRVCNLQLRSHTSLATLIDQHASILSAIDEKDGDMALSAMQKHLHGILNDLPAIEREHQSLFQ